MPLGAASGVFGLDFGAAPCRGDTREQMHGGGRSPAKGLLLSLGRPVPWSNNNGNPDTKCTPSPGLPRLCPPPPLSSSFEDEQIRQEEEEKEEGSRAAASPAKKLSVLAAPPSASSATAAAASGFSSSSSSSYSAPPRRCGI